MISATTRTGAAAIRQRLRRCVTGLCLACWLGFAGCAADQTGQQAGQHNQAGSNVANAGNGGAASGSGAAGTLDFSNGSGGMIPDAGRLPSDAGPIVEDAGSCNQDVDIVFVLDVSGSMYPMLSKLQSEVELVDMALQKKHLPGPAHYGLVIFVDDVMMMNNGAPYADVKAFQDEVSAQVTATTAMSGRQANPANTEQNLSWPENSLDALYVAATGFAWRPVASTLRTIIHITDASFWDQMRVSSAAGDPMKLEPAGMCSATLLGIVNPMGCTMTSSVHSYAETIQALRDNSIWVNTFSAKTGGPPDANPAPASHGNFRGADVDVGFGFLEPYDGQNSIAVSTGGLAWNIDDVYDGVISVATPINQAVADHHCVTYPPPPPPPE